MTTKAKRIGRTTGKGNRGYWYREGRGWYRSDRTPLLDPHGQQMKDRSTPHGELLIALATSHIRDQQPAPVKPVAIPATSEGLTMLELADQFLAGLKTGLASRLCPTGVSDETYRLRADYLFDFATGLPARFRGKNPTPKEVEQNRIHAGYGSRPVASLIVADIHNWLAAHPSWKRSRRTAIASVKPAFSWARIEGLIKVNPFAEVGQGATPARLTYITEQQEATMLRFANKAFATAIRVLIRTGMRPGKEFARCTAKHCERSDKGLIVRFKAEETKTRKRPRIIYITDEPIIKIFEAAIEAHPTGPLFRNQRRTAWNHLSLQLSFRRLRAVCEENDLAFELDAEACTYAFRHTFAKRVASGHWNGGRGCTIETLAKLMGNSPAIARKYSEYCESYTDPLWAAV